MTETIASGTSRHLCPLACGWQHDVPPPSAADAAGIPWPPVGTDIGEAISHVAGEATLRVARRTEAALVAHLGTHTMLEFVTVIERLRAEVEQSTPASSDPGSGA